MPIDTARDGKVFSITLNRPQAMNAIDVEMYEQLTAAWDEFEHNDGLHVAIVTGAGERAFCAGRDLVKSVADSTNDWSQNREQGRLTPDGIWKPVIAAINGHCLAAGFALMLGCDLRIAAPNATFGTMAAKRGIVAGGGQTQRLMRQVGFAKAMEMILFADRIDANEAHRIGLVNTVCEVGKAYETAREWAGRLLKNGPLAIRAIKEAAHEGAFEMPLKEGLALEMKHYHALMQTEDAAEGGRAFAEKREPNFMGR